MCLLWYGLQLPVLKQEGPKSINLSYDYLSLAPAQRQTLGTFLWTTCHRDLSPAILKPQTQGRCQGECSQPWPAGLPCENATHCQVSEHQGTVHPHPGGEGEMSGFEETVGW